MQDLVLRTRVYGSYRGKLFSDFRLELNSMLSELEVTIDKIRSIYRGHIRIRFQGRDEEFVTNLLRREFGLTQSLDEIVAGESYNGQLIDTGKVGYGDYVHIGVLEPKRTDALLPLHRLRGQLEMPESSIREINRTMVLVDNYPLDVRVSWVDPKSGEIEAGLAEETIDRINAWRKDDHERLLLFGAKRGMIEDALGRTNHHQDIYEIEQLGKYEFSLRCKRSTRATGIVAAIGPRLKGLPIHLFIPDEIEERRNGST